MTLQDQLLDGLRELRETFRDQNLYGEILISLWVTMFVALIPMGAIYHGWVPDVRGVIDSIMFPLMVGLICFEVLHLVIIHPPSKHPVIYTC